MNVEQIREELAANAAFKRYTLPEEAWYSATIHDPADRGALWLGVDSRNDAGLYDGCIGEWSVHWVELSGRSAPKLSIFDDAWAAVVASDFFDVVLPFADKWPTRSQLVEALTAAGWTDTTARVEPSRV